MYQRRDGVTEIVDHKPHAEEPKLATLLSRPHWGSTLIWYMRTLACVWIAKGVFNWFVVLGMVGRFGDFVMLPRPLQISVGFFAAADLIAAVAMWLAAPWGGAMWLLCAAAESATPLLGSRGSFLTPYGAIINGVLILGYVLISLLAVRERR